MIGTIRASATRVATFVYRQKRNYRVAVLRSAANRFLANLTDQYSSIYTVALGADSLQLGAVSSIGAAISALIATPVGWLVDRQGIKRFYLLAIVLLAGQALIYAVARDWRLIIVASVLASISVRLAGTGCSVLCADSVRNRDRVTAQNFCATLSSLASVLSPLVAAHLITAFGGIGVEGIRPLYYLRSLGYGIVALFVATQLQEPRLERVAPGRANVSFIAGFRQLLKENSSLSRWILVASLTSLPMAMTSPFVQLFAHEVKGADGYVLGAMATAAVLARLSFGIPLGRLADRVGRKRIVYMLTPLWYASNLMLVLSSTSTTLVLAAILQTFCAFSSGVIGAMTLELVRLEQQGRWSGLLGLFTGMIAVPAPILGGLIWRDIGPEYVFLLPVAVDLLLRIPLLATVPETLHGPSPGGLQAGRT